MVGQVTIASELDTLPFKFYSELRVGSLRFVVSSVKARPRNTVIGLSAKPQLNAVAFRATPFPVEFAYVPQKLPHRLGVICLHFRD
jgi:hypothetical protein